MWSRHPAGSTTTIDRERPSKFVADDRGVRVLAAMAIHPDHGNASALWPSRHASASSQGVETLETSTAEVVERPDRIGRALGTPKTQTGVRP